MHAQWRHSIPVDHPLPGGTREIGARTSAGTPLPALHRTRSRLLGASLLAVGLLLGAVWSASAQTLGIGSVTPGGRNAGDPLTEGSLDGTNVELRLTDATWANFVRFEQFRIDGGPGGLTVELLVRLDDRRMRLRVSFDGRDFDDDITDGITITAQAAIAGSSTP